MATTVVTVLVIAGSGLYLWTLDWPQMMVWLKYLLTVVFVLTIVICAGYTPVRLKANSEKITVTRLFKPIEIPICGIKEMKRIGKSDISDSIRTFGSGGLFGYLGRFKCTALGRYTIKPMFSVVPGLMNSYCISINIEYTKNAADPSAPDCVLRPG